MKKKFIVRPEKNSVIAMMEEKHTIAEELMRANKKFAFVLNRLDFMFGRKESTNPFFKSEAIAHDGDEFNKKIGCEIAEQKVDYKYHKSMTKQYNRYIDLLESMISTMETLRNKHISKSRKIEQNMKRFS